MAANDLNFVCHASPETYQGVYWWNTVTAQGSSVVIDYGDGTPPVTKSGTFEIDHTYAAPGDYTVSIQNPAALTAWEGGWPFNLEVPAGEIRKASGLVTLGWIGNKFSLTGELSSLPNLASLYWYDAQNVAITGADVRGCVNLTSLTLYACSQLTLAEGDLAPLTKVASLWLSGLSGITLPFSEILALPLTELGLGELPLTIAAGQLGSKATLTNVALWDLPNATVNAGELAALPLASLWLENLPHVSLGAGDLYANRTRLSYLILSNLPLAQTNLGEIGALTLLTYLKVSDCPGVQVGATELGALVQARDILISNSPLVAVPSNLHLAIRLRYTFMFRNNCTCEQVTSILSQLYNMKSTRVYSGGSIYLDGNESPTGIYENVNPPTTGQQYIYQMKTNANTLFPKKWTNVYVVASPTFTVHASAGDQLDLYDFEVQAGRTVVIYWGDGTSVSCTGKANRRKTYSVAGDYPVVIDNPMAVVHLDLNYISASCAAGQLTKFKNLKGLLIYDTDFPVAEGEIRQLVNLETLYLSSIPNVHLGPGEIAPLTKLYEFTYYLYGYQACGRVAFDFSEFAGKPLQAIWLDNWRDDPEAVETTVEPGDIALLGPDLELLSLPNIRGAIGEHDFAPLSSLETLELGPGIDASAVDFADLVDKSATLSALLLDSTGMHVQAGQMGALRLANLYLKAEPNVVTGEGELANQLFTYQVQLWNCPQVHAGPTELARAGVSLFAVVNCPNVALQTTLNLLTKCGWLHYENNLAQEEVDSVMTQLYAIGAARTYAWGGSLYLKDTNARPSGFRGDVVPPTSGFETYYALLNTITNPWSEVVVNTVLPIRAELVADSDLSAPLYRHLMGHWMADAVSSLTAPLTRVIGHRPAPSNRVSPTLRRGSFFKAPGDRLDFSFDWTGWLAPREEIVEQQITVHDDLELHEVTFGPSGSTFWLSGGVAGATYTITIAVTTNQERIYERIESLIVQPIEIDETAL